MNTDNKSYQNPPLKGTHSYNTVAGFSRLSGFAGLVIANMPFLTSSTNPPLTFEEAWDVAAFVNSMDRPVKDLSRDWPDISKKPYDHPFSPFADHCYELQHKFGLFLEMASSKKNEQETRN